MSSLHDRRIALTVTTVGILAASRIEAFKNGLAIAFLTSIVMLLVAAAPLLMRGGRYVHEDALAGRAHTERPAP